MKLKRFLCLLCVLACLLPAGCGNGAGSAVSSEPAGSSAQGAASSEEEPPLPEGPDGVNPLTGEPMEACYETARPTAVMLNNLKAAQPQLGVSRADLIYEVVAEGGITRMLAVYQTLEGVENLGSIRSTRPYYLKLALGHDALLAHAGGSPEAYADIQAWGVDNMDGVNGGSDAKIFWRDPERRKKAGYEHCMLTSGAEIKAYAEEHFRTEHAQDYREGLRFAAQGSSADGGSPAAHVSVRFSNYKTGTFDYQPADQTYWVGQYGDAYRDGNNDEQVAVSNLLVLETAISTISGDTAGRQQVRLSGEGSGTLYSGGCAIPIRWSKSARSQPFTYTTEDGRPLELRRGTSYICIISPKTSSVTVS